MYSQIIILLSFLIIVKCGFSYPNTNKDIDPLPKSRTANDSDIELYLQNESILHSLVNTRNAYHSRLQYLDRGQLGDEIELLLRTRQTPRKTHVGMLSVYRANDEYLYKTLSSVLSALFGSNLTSSFRGSIISQPKLSLYIGSPDNDYVKFTKYNSMVNVVPMDEKFWNTPYATCFNVWTPSQHIPLFKENILRVKKGENLIRMMEGLVGIALNESNAIRDFSKHGTLLLEDDIILMPDSATRLDATVSAIENVLGEEADYLLSCYVCKSKINMMGGHPSNYEKVNPSTEHFNFTELRTTPDQFSRFQFFVAKQFTYAQCIYMPAKTAEKVAAWVRKNYLSPSEGKSWIASDQQLGDFSLTFDIPILAMHEPIAQHIGKSTTGLCPYFHQGIGEVQIEM